MIATMPASNTIPPMIAHATPRRPELWLIITGQAS
jgi:hypothetical protein